MADDERSKAMLARRDRERAAKAEYMRGYRQRLRQGMDAASASAGAQARHRRKPIRKLSETTRRRITYAWVRARLRALAGLEPWLQELQFRLDGLAGDQAGLEARIAALEGVAKGDGGDKS